MAWDHPEGEKRMFQWEGLSGWHVSLADRHVTFANRCAELLKERFPDRDYYVSTHAYGHSRPAPIAARPADNVIITSVANFMFRPDEPDKGSPNDTPHREQFKDWAKVTKNLIWRPNTGGNLGWRIGRPSISPTQTIKDFELLEQVGCDGIATDVVWEHWAPHAPDYYLMGQLAWDLSLDGQAVLDEFYRRGFGPAAEEIRAYWKLIEDTYLRLKEVAPPKQSEHGHVTGTFLAELEIYDDAFFAKANALLDDAMDNLAGAPEKYRKRVEFLRVGLEWDRLLMANLKLLRKWESPASVLSEEERARAIENGKEMIRLANSLEFPHAINGGPVRPSTGRMTKFMPESLRSPGEYEKYLPQE
jgi:hypothetical protein